MRRRFIFVFGMMLMLSGGSGTLMAQEDPIQENPNAVMDTVVVTASRQEEPTARVPAHVTVVKAEDIENSTAQNVAEVLSMIGGAHVMDTGGNRRNYWVDIRGFGESSPQNLLLLVDGRRVNLPDLSGPDWNLIPLERIERIEVVRGSRGTTLYGDNASQGVINIITKEGRRLEGNVSAKYGSYNTFKGNGSISGASERISYDLTVGYLESDGYRDNSDSQAKDIGTNVKIDPSDWVRLHFSAGYHYDDTRNPGSILESQFDAGADRTDTFSPDDFSEVDDYYFKAGLGFDILTGDAFNLEASFRNRDKKLYGSSAAYWFEADTETDIFSLSPQLVFREDFDGISNRVILGGDYIMAKQDYDNHSEYFGFPSEIVADLKKENTAFYVQDELGIGRQWSLSGGYRLDRVVFKYEPATPVDTRTFDEEGYNAGINYSFGSNSHIYANYSHSFRYPVLDEQFYYFNSTLDTTMEPQTSNEYELGVSIGFLEGLAVSVNLFRIETEDEIFFNFYSGYNENLDGDTTRQGVELGLTWQWKALTLNGTYTRMNIDIDSGQFDGKEFPFVPDQKATAKANLRLGYGLSVGLDAVYIGESVLVSDFRNEYDKVDGYTVVNAKLQYAWRQLTFFADLNNIFNEEYSAFSGLGYNSSYAVEPGYFPAPDFNFLVGVTGRFGS